MSVYIVGFQGLDGITVLKVFVNKTHAMEYRDQEETKAEIFSFPVEDYYGTKMGVCYGCKKMWSKTVLTTVSIDDKEVYRCQNC